MINITKPASRPTQPDTLRQGLAWDGRDGEAEMSAEAREAVGTEGTDRTERTASPDGTAPAAVTEDDAPRRGIQTQRIRAAISSTGTSSNSLASTSRP